MIYAPRNCVWCGAPYQPRRVDCRTCSAECRKRNNDAERNAKRPKVVREPRSCRRCDREFSPLRKDSWVCPDCREHERNARSPRPCHLHYEVGQRIGELTIVKIDVRRPLTPSQIRQGRTIGSRAAEVVCSCGKGPWVVTLANLKQGWTQSCGHKRDADRHTRGRGIRAHPSKTRWAMMMQRCYNPKHRAYRSYGGRGITVWPQWHTCSTFLDYLDTVLGPCPEGHSLDRIDNDRGYEPGNLRWADAKTQNSNRRWSLKIVS